MNGSFAVNGGAAVSITAPFGKGLAMLEGPGADSASAESARTEKVEAIASCLDIIELDF